MFGTKDIRESTVHIEIWKQRRIPHMTSNIDSLSSPGEIQIDQFVDTFLTMMCSLFDIIAVIHTHFSKLFRHRIDKLVHRGYFDGFSRSNDLGIAIGPSASLLRDSGYDRF
jgi:hypothetical protein